MMPYYIIFIVLALFSLSDLINIRREQRLIVFFISGLILILFAGLRYDSQDWMPYKNAFDEVYSVGFDYSRFELSSFFEPLYNVIVFLVTLFTNNVFVMFTVIATISVTLNLSFYRRYSSYFLLVVVLYFVHTFLLRETILIRSGVAAGIVLWALPAAYAGRFWKFSLLIVLAMGFHLASIVAFLIYIIYRLDWSPQTWRYLIGASFIIGMFMPFGKLLGLLPSGGVFDRILVYSWMVGGNTAGVLTNPTIIKQLFFAIVGLVYWKTLQEKMPYFKMLFVPLLISVCWLMVWNDFAIVAGRMATFFSVTEVLVVPMLIYLSTEKSKPLMGVMIIIYALTTLALNLLSANVLGYKFILEQ